MPEHLLERPKPFISSPPRAVDAYLISTGLSVLGRFLRRLRPGYGAGGRLIQKTQAELRWLHVIPCRHPHSRLFPLSQLPNGSFNQGSVISLCGVFFPERSDISRALAVGQALGNPEISLFILTVFIEHLLRASHIVLGVKQRAREVHGPVLRELIEKER